MYGDTDMLSRPVKKALFGDFVRAANKWEDNIAGWHVPITVDGG